MDSNSSFYQRTDLVQKLNRNLEQSAEICLNLRDVKNKNITLESEINTETENNKLYENQKEKLLEELKELKKKNEKLQNELKESKDTIILLQSKLDEKNKE